jgi:hypothetical protein
MSSSLHLMMRNQDDLIMAVIEDNFQQQQLQDKQRTEIKEYFDFIFAKQIASKEEKYAFFIDEKNIPDNVKEETAKKELIRAEWCSFMRRYVDFVMTKVTDDNGNHTCIILTKL